MLICHILGLLLGFAMDLIIGDPHNFPHPVRWIGRWIGYLDKQWLGDNHKAEIADREKGLMLVFAVIFPVFAIALALSVICYAIHPVLFVIFEAVLTCYCLSTKSLKDESSLVIKELTNTTVSKEQALVNARKALSMIVGRDTVSLSEEEIIKATVETVAENTADGVIGPLLYMGLFGPVAGILYKAINTMDSMVGYKNERYEHFGYCAAKLDDIAGFLPARLSGLLIIAAAYILGGFDGKNALRIFMRDRYNHKSPNSAHSESAVAGALGVKLGGGAFYFGKWVEKPSMGDDFRPIEVADVARAHKLMYVSAFLCFLVFEIIMLLVLVIQFGVLMGALFFEKLRLSHLLG